jgi:hypothetical protein
MIERRLRKVLLCAEFTTTDAAARAGSLGGGALEAFDPAWPVRVAW